MGSARSEAKAGRNDDGSAGHSESRPGVRVGRRTQTSGGHWGQALEDLDGRVAVVTGGASGIGRGIAEALLEQGARVVIADVEAPVLEGTLKELADAGDVRGVVTDVTSADSVEALAAHVFGRDGACHLLFNNAGVTSGGGGRPWEQEANDWACAAYSRATSSSATGSTSAPSCCTAGPMPSGPVGSLRRR